MTTRTEFLARVRAQIEKTSGLFPAAVARHPERPGLLAEALRRELSERWRETADRFRQEFERVGGTFHRVASVAEVPAAVTAIAREREARKLIAWPPAALGLDLATPLGAAGLEVEPMPESSPATPEARERLRAVTAAADLGVTGADLAIAETGTLVLVSGAGRPRSTSLLPPTHVAVFDRTVLVESLEQVGIVLEAWHEEEQPAWRGGAIHFITGPSRTADIELTLTRGVHGPREVHAIFVDGGLRG